MGQSVSTPHGSGDDPNDTHAAFSHNDLVSIALAAHGATPTSAPNANAAPRHGSPRRRSRSRRPSNGSTHGPIEISNPTDVEQGVHIEWDEETGSFRGVPAQWRAHFAKVGHGGAAAGAAAALGASGSAPSSMASPHRTAPLSASRSADRSLDRGGVRRMPSGSRRPHNGAGELVQLQQPINTSEPLRARSASSSSINATIGVDAEAARPVPSPPHAQQVAASAAVAPSNRSLRSAHRRSKSSDFNTVDTATGAAGTSLRSPPSSSSILASPTASSSRLAKASNPSLSRTGSSSIPMQSPSRSRAPPPNLTRPEKSHRRTPSSSSGPLSPGSGSFSSSGAGGAGTSNPTSPSTPQAPQPPSTPSKALQSSASMSALGGYGKGIAAAFSATGANASPGRGGPYAGTPRSPNVDRRPSDPTWQHFSANSNTSTALSASETTANTAASLSTPPSSSSKPRRPSNPNLTIRTASRSPGPPRAPPGPMPMSSKGPPPTTPLPERPPNAGPLKPSAADVTTTSAITNPRPRRMSARRSRVISISPRGSLMSTTSLVAALAAAVQREEAEKTHQRQPVLSSRRRDRDSIERSPVPASGAPIPPRIASQPRSPTAPSTSDQQTSFALAAARNGSVTSLTTPTATAPSAPAAAAESLSYQNVQIHPMFQRFIAEAQRLEREQRDNPQLTASTTSLSGTTKGSGGASSTATANSLVQLLKEGALGEAGRELAELTSMEVTPANLDVAMAGLIEPGVSDPHAVFTAIVPFAEGMSGDVHMAKDAVVHSPVAIKIIPRDHPRSKDKIKRLPVELHLMRASRHPNVVAFIGAYLTADAVWLAMEWMDAGSLADFLYADEEEEAVVNASSGSLALSVGPFTAHGIAYVTSQIARALEYLHSNYRLHRDVRSDNILLTLDGQCKLADFGYAIETHAPVCEPVGTPYWIAPEVAKAAARAFAVKAEGDPAAGDPEAALDVLDNEDIEYYGSGVDVWALGITVYEMAARMYPYAELDEVAALQAIAMQGAPQLPDVGRDRLGTGGVGFFSRLVTRDPTERPTASEVLADPFVKQADMNQGRAQLVALIEQVNGRV